MFSVVFSTFNGERTLPRMLARLRDIEVPFSGWEVIAVDNGSTDRSAELLHEAAAWLPLRYVHHPARGKNKALNAGLALARGDLLVFTDDDVLPDPRWLPALLQASLDFPRHDIFGGAIVPSWAGSPERWILEDVPIGMTYAITDPDLPRGDVYPGLIWGPNMMVRRRVFEAGLRFNETIGPSVGQYVMGSETEFNLRASAAGHRCCFEPGAIVAHMIRDFQMQREWVLARAYRFGRNMWNQEQAEQTLIDVPRILGVPRWRLRSYLDHWIGAARHRLRADRDHAFKHDWELSFLRGYLAQWWQTR